MKSLASIEKGVVFDFLGDEIRVLRGVIPNGDIGFSPPEVFRLVRTHDFNGDSWLYLSDIFNKIG